MPPPPSPHTQPQPSRGAIAGSVWQRWQDLVVAVASTSEVDLLDWNKACGYPVPEPWAYPPPIKRLIAAQLGECAAAVPCIAVSW